MRLPAFADRPGSFPIPAFPDLSVLELEAFGKPVNSRYSRLVVTANDGAAVPPAEGWISLDKPVSTVLGGVQCFALAAPLLIRDVPYEPLAPPGMADAPGVGSVRLVIDTRDSVHRPAPAVICFHALRPRTAMLWLRPMISIY